MKEVAIVILNYNGITYLKTFLPGLKKYLPASAAIIIADNQSTDESTAWLKVEHPEIELIELSQNFGFAKGYNEALKQIDYPYFLLLNSDVEVKEDFVSPLLQLIKTSESIAAVQPKILSQAEPAFFEYAGACGGMKDYLGYTFCRGRIFDFCEKDQGQYEDQKEIFWASGAAFLIKADLYKIFGGFDEDFFAHMEEIDLCWRLKNAGYKIMVEPSSIVYHVGGGTLNYGNPRKTFLNFRNNLRTLVKNEKGSKLIWLFPTRLVLDGLAGLQFLFKGQVKHLFAIIKAHWAVFFEFPYLLKKRKANKAIIKQISIGEKRLRDVYSKSIIWQYFVKGIKKYNRL